MNKNPHKKGDILWMTSDIGGRQIVHLAAVTHAPDGIGSAPPYCDVVCLGGRKYSLPASQLTTERPVRVEPAAMVALIK